VETYIRTAIPMGDDSQLCLSSMGMAMWMSVSTNAMRTAGCGRSLVAASRLRSYGSPRVSCHSSTSGSGSVADL